MAVTCSLELASPWLSFSFSQPLKVLSWSINRPGLVVADRIVWREVKNKDLPIDLDVTLWLHDELASNGLADAVTMLTSCDIGNYQTECVELEGIRATAVATVGLSNAERVGARVDYSGEEWGTVNVAVFIDQGLRESALIEAISIVSQARTAAIMDAEIALSTGRATGTGTDCIAVAAPAGEIAYAGLHTALGEAVGLSVYRVVAKGINAWRDSRAMWTATAVKRTQA